MVPLLFQFEQTNWIPWRWLDAPDLPAEAQTEPRRCRGDPVSAGDQWTRPQSTNPSCCSPEVLTGHPFSCCCGAFGQYRYQRDTGQMKLVISAGSISQPHPSASPAAVVGAHVPEQEGCPGAGAAHVSRAPVCPLLWVSPARGEGVISVRIPVASRALRVPQTLAMGKARVEAPFLPALWV